MNCYVCGTLRPEGANYCPGCGRYCADDPNVRNSAPLAEESVFDEALIPEPERLSEPEAPVEPEQQAAPVPATRRKHRPVLIPVLIMAVLFAVGTVSWFLMPYPSDSDNPPPETTRPSAQQPPMPSGKNPIKEEVPLETYLPTDESCFQIQNGSVSLVPERYDGSPILVIPSEIGGQAVTSIADGGFAGLEDVTTLVLPETLETIGSSAFADSKKLRGVYIPDSVKSIGSNAFAGCIDMESVSIPLTTASIGADAFDGCASLLYIFYEGTFEEWEALYHEYVNPFTCACCSDGDYYHGAVTP